MNSANWLCYILECVDGTFYTGITNSINVRLAKHDAGIASKYTRGRLPVKLIYEEFCGSKSNALKREYAIKKLSREKKEALVFEYEESLKRRIERT